MDPTISMDLKSQCHEIFNLRIFITQIRPVPLEVPKKDFTFFFSMSFANVKLTPGEGATGK